MTISIVIISAIITTTITITINSIIITIITSNIVRLYFFSGRLSAATWSLEQLSRSMSTQLPGDVILVMLMVVVVVVIVILLLLIMIMLEHTLL